MARLCLFVAGAGSNPPLREPCRDVTETCFKFSPSFPGTQLKMGNQDTSARGEAALHLPGDLRPIFEQSYPRFSDAEYARRHAGMAQAMKAAEIDNVLIV